MNAIAVVARARSPLPVILAGLLAATFAVGFLTGASVPRSMSAAQSGDRGTGAASRAVTGAATSAVTPVLDTTRVYTTVQGGILVAPGSTRTTSVSPTCAEGCGPEEVAVAARDQEPRTPVLDATMSYTTVQHGVVVLPRR